MRWTPVLFPLGLMASFTCAVSGTTAEVYGPQMFLMTAALGVLLISDKWAGPGLLLWGLSGICHGSSIVLLPTILLLLPRRKATARGVCLAALSMGSLLFLMIRAKASPPLNWGHPCTLGNWMWTWSGAQYQGHLWGIPDLAGLVSRFRAIAHWMVKEDLLPCFLFLALAGGILHGKGRLFLPVLVMNLILVSCVKSFFGSSDIRSYLLPGLLILLFLSCFGASGLLAHPRVWVRWVGGMLFLLGCVQPLWRAAGLSWKTNLRARVGPDIHARSLFRHADLHSIVVLSADASLFNAWWLREGRQYRRDCVVVGRTELGWPGGYAAFRGHHPNLALPREAELLYALRGLGVEEKKGGMSMATLGLIRVMEPSLRTGQRSVYWELSSPFNDSVVSDHLHPHGMLGRLWAIQVESETPFFQYRRHVDLHEGVLRHLGTRERMFFQDEDGVALLGSRFRYASRLMNRGELALARQEIEAVLAWYYPYFPAHHNLGLILEAMGDSRGAQASLDLARSFQPRFAALGDVIELPGSARVR